MPESMPQLQLRRQGDHVLIRRLTEQRQQPIALSEYRSHLVHHTTRRADHHVFDFLAEQRYFTWSNVDVECFGDGFHHCDFERG